MDARATEPLEEIAAELAVREGRIEKCVSEEELRREHARGEELRQRLLVARAEALEQLAQLSLAGRLARDCGDDGRMEEGTIDCRA